MTKNRSAQLTIGTIGVLAFAAAALSTIVTQQVLPLAVIGLLVGVVATVVVVVGFVRQRQVTTGMVTSLVTPAVAIAALTPMFQLGVVVPIAVVSGIFAVEIIVLLAVGAKRPAKGQLRHG
ncbi:hypothetical protein [Gulosibacter sp. ACHW.36C]|uniref:Integral membrane protein n=1 Tax=Gulosibacter sediminis TaxID=1729695 RepID=A0ABY4MX47_9MICO|nr:hypothetical protein [Gulosibacter sediminis]UQN14991.1 hypothetical protein M3M28_00545 [Gulosibacter sediminis]